MLRRSLLPFAVLAAVALIAGCRDAAPPSRVPDPPPAAGTAPATSATVAAWTGQWTGPEGTFLRIEPAPDGADRYTITIRDLDQARTYAGRAAGAELRFLRDGAEATIRASDGAGTGMKWLAGKRDCLVIRAGEGYCRD